MAETKPKKTAPKLFDIAKPGKSAPSSTSRPVIITNRPVLKDPMVIKVDTGDEDAPTTETAASSSEMKHKVDIQPLHIDLSEVLPSSAPEVKKDDKKAEDKPADEKVEDQPPVEEDKPEPTEPAAEDEVVPPAAEEPAKDSEEAAESVAVKVDKPAEKAPKTTGEKVIAPPEHDTEEDKPEPTETPAEASPKPETSAPEEDSFSSSQDEPSLDNSDRPVLSEKETKAAEEAKKKAEEQEKIIASGEFYLPINAVEKRRTKRNVILGTLFIVILIAVAVLAAWDADIFSIPGFQAPTHFL